MALIEINWKPPEKDLRQFGLIWWPLACTLVGGLGYAQGWLTPTLLAALVAAALPAAALGWLAPARLRPLFLAWMCAAFPIGWVMSHLLLAVIYYLVITPIGCLLRLRGQDPMQRSFDRSAKTYWVPHRPTTDSSRYFRQF